MTHLKAKAPTALISGDALGIVAHSPAINTRVDTATLRDFQASYLARRSRLAPEMARVVAQLAFGGAA